MNKSGDSVEIHVDAKERGMKEAAKNIFLHQISVEVGKRLERCASCFCVQLFWSVVEMS